MQTEKRITKKQAIEIHRDFYLLKKYSSVYEFVKPSIDNFYKKNDLKIRHVVNQSNECVSEFCEVDETGEVKKTPKTETEPEKIIYKPGKDENGFNEAYNELMNQTIVVKL